MNTIVWKRLLLSICALAFILCGIELWSSLSYGGTTGLSVGTSTSVPFHATVFVQRNSAAWDSGLRTGDVIDVKDMAPAERYRLFIQALRAGEQLHLSVVTVKRVRHVTVTAKYRPYAWDAWVGYAAFPWMVLFATLLSWKRPDSAEARVLSLLLLDTVINTALASNNWITPWPLADVFTEAVSTILTVAAYALYATYAMLFAQPPSPLRRALMWLSYISAGAAAVYYLFAFFAIWTALVDPSAPALFSPASQIAAGAPFVLFPLLCAVATLAQTRGAERTRFSWGASPLCLLYIIDVMESVAGPLNLPWFSVLFKLSNVAVFLAPLGLTYSLLNRRLLDIGFVLNRAAVFSVVSILLVGTFVLVEWGISEWLSSASHTTNIAISAGLALVLGLSVRFVHARVDRVLDTVFFRKRHEDEHAIRTFAHEAAYITDATTVVQRAIATLERHADASFVTIALDDGAGRYGSVDENDPAIVALRAWHKTLDLHTVETQLSGEYAYPMIARGRLVGALVLGPKRSGDTYAPDESGAIAQLAHSVGAALDVLCLNNQSEPHSLAHLTDALRAAVYEAVSDGFERLGQRITS